MFILINTASNSDTVNYNLKWISCVCIATDISIRSSHWGLPWWPSGEESTCQWRRHGFDPWVGKISPGRGNGNLLQYSCWEIPQTEEPGGLQSLGSCKRVRYNLATKHTWTVVTEVERSSFPWGKWWLEPQVSMDEHLAWGDPVLGQDQRASLHVRHTVYLYAYSLLHITFCNFLETTQREKEIADLAELGCMIALSNSHLVSSHM